MAGGGCIRNREGFFLEGGEKEDINMLHGWSGGMSALLTFRRRHVGWQRGSSEEDDDKAVKWK